MIRVLSLGAGVQSTTLALMAAAGEIERPDCAIFADTQNEPKQVYEHLAWLRSGVLPFPVHVVSLGNLGEQILLATQRKSLKGSHARPPFYVRNEDGSAGIIRRQCTGDYKIDVIEAKTRELLGLKPRQRWPKKSVVESWVGISTDEAHRMKSSANPAIILRYPLVDAGISRSDCLGWLERHGYAIPAKSACVFCPYRSDQQWRDLRDTDAEGFAYAVKLDKAIRRGLRGHTLTGQLYLHRSMQPLEEADLSTWAEKGQPDLFGQECDGVCGV